MKFIAKCLVPLLGILWLIFGGLERLTWFVAEKVDEYAYGKDEQ